jgi:hypothetical protein
MHLTLEFWFGVVGVVIGIRLSVTKAAGRPMRKRAA